MWLPDNRLQKRRPLSFVCRCVVEFLAWKKTEGEEKNRARRKKEIVPLITGCGMAADGAVTWKEIIVTNRLAIDSSTAGIAWRVSPGSISTRTSAAPRSTTAWSRSSSSGHSMRSRCRRTRARVWVFSACQWQSTRCREVRPLWLSCRLSGMFLALAL